MANQYKNHIVYFGDTLIDLRSDTVTAETLLEGYTAHDASGALITGAYVPTSSAITVITTQDSHGGEIKEIVAVDISSDTVTAATLLQGYTAHDRSGNAITGTYVPPVSNIQANKNVTPSESQQIITPDTGYDALAQITVSAISATYVGSGITRRSSTDLIASGATVTAPAGYYESSASKAIATGTATAPTSISGTGSTVTTGTNTLTFTKTVSVTPRITTAGYISEGTAGNASVSLSANVTTKAAATITPGTTNQTIASGTYLTGAQTIQGDANLVGSNILSGVSIFGVAGTVTFVTYRTGSGAPSSSLGVDGDIYLQTS